MKLSNDFTFGMIVASVIVGSFWTVQVKHNNDEWKREAVKRGFATYTVNEKGQVTWHWKEK